MVWLFIYGVSYLYVYVVVNIDVCKGYDLIMYCIKKFW